MAVELWLDLGRPGSFGPAGNGCCVSWNDLVASEAGVPQQPPQVIIS